MAIKVVVKGQKDPEKTDSVKIPAINPRPSFSDNFIFIKTIKRIINVMIMDVRFRTDKKTQENFEDYSRFSELARGKQ